MITPEALYVLDACVPDSTRNTVTIPDSLGQLARPLYEEVNEVLSRLGGKWKRGRGHVFPYDPAPLLAGVLASGEMPPKNPTAYFPTPKQVVADMVALGRLDWRRPGTRILEPSAGTGAIARAIREAAPDAVLHCCEVLPVNRASLEAQGFDVVAEDFLAYQPEEPYDVVLMNPPFSLEGDATAYITHVNRAWELLGHSGYLVAVVPPGWLTGSAKKPTAFREFVCDRLDFHEIGAGAFKDAGTMVNTYLIHGERTQGAGWRTEPHNGWKSFHAWQASLYIDNEREFYEAILQASDDLLPGVCLGIADRLRRDGVPIVLRTPDLEDLRQHYRECR